jgi:chromate reductase
MTKLLFLSGSIRRDSLNKKLTRCAADMARKIGGAEITYIDLADYPMPFYNGDDEAATGLPENAKKLKQLFIQHDGVFISSPEYNSSIPALLKNAIDWISRPEKTDPYYLVAFVDKVIAICSASPGELGGMRGLAALRIMFTNIYSIVVPKQLGVKHADKAFDANGNLNDPGQQQALHSVISQFITVATKLKK